MVQVEWAGRGRQAARAAAWAGSGLACLCAEVLCVRACAWCACVRVKCGSRWTAYRYGVRAKPRRGVSRDTAARRRRHDEKVPRHRQLQARSCCSMCFAAGSASARSCCAHHFDPRCSAHKPSGVSAVSTHAHRPLALLAPSRPHAQGGGGLAVPALRARLGATRAPTDAAAHR